VEKKRADRATTYRTFLGKGGGLGVEDGGSAAGEKDEEKKQGGAPLLKRQNAVAGRLKIANCRNSLQGIESGPTRSYALGSETKSGGGRKKKKKTCAAGKEGPMIIGYRDVTHDEKTPKKKNQRDANRQNERSKV